MDSSQQQHRKKTIMVASIIAIVTILVIVLVWYFFFRSTSATVSDGDSFTPPTAVSGKYLDVKKATYTVSGQATDVTSAVQKLFGTSAIPSGSVLLCASAANSGSSCTAATVVPSSGALTGGGSFVIKYRVAKVSSSSSS